MYRLCDIVSPVLRFKIPLIRGDFGSTEEIDGQFETFLTEPAGKKTKLKEKKQNEDKNS